MIVVILSISVLLAVVAGFFLENKRIRITAERISHRNVKAPFTIVQVSDLHNAVFGTGQSRLIDRIKESKPDYIVITGDLFNRKNKKAFRNSFTFVRKALTICPVFFAEGNHECALKETGKAFIDSIGDMGVTILRDEFVDLPEFRLIGLKQYAAPETLSAMLSHDKLNVVMAHRPELFPIYAGTGADVILSGHAHGGQIRLFGRGIYAPEQGVFPTYTDGVYRIDKSTLFVSRGLGNTVPVPRVFNTPELCVLTFEKDRS